MLTGFGTQRIQNNSQAYQGSGPSSLPLPVQKSAVRAQLHTENLDGTMISTAQGRKLEQQRPGSA